MGARETGTATQLAVTSSFPELSLIQLDAFPMKKQTDADNISLKLHLAEEQQNSRYSSRTHGTVV